MRGLSNDLASQERHGPITHVELVASAVDFVKQHKHATLRLAEFYPCFSNQRSILVRLKVWELSVGERNSDAREEEVSGEGVTPFSASELEA